MPDVTGGSVDWAGVTVDPARFHRGYVSADPDAELRGMIALLDQQARLPDVKRLREWTLDMLDPSPGDTALDVGSGTGEDAQRLAAAVGPSGSATGVEPHAGLRAEAVRRAAASGSTVQSVDGDAAALPCADGSVDVLRCERVWQHLPDPAAAAREVARVLAPGGRAAVIDADWGSLVQWPGDPEVLARVHAVAFASMLHPFSGRHLKRLLVEAGLAVDPHVGSAALVMPDAAVLGSGIVRDHAERAAAAGQVSRAEVDALLAETASAVTEGTVFVAVTMFSVVAHQDRSAGLTP